MHIHKTIIIAGLISLAATASVDVSKGTVITPPDSEEAVKLSNSDKAVKTAPKDNSHVVEALDSDKFKKPQLSNQKLDVPDTESLTSANDIAVAAKDDHPVVLNDYDPNNLGVPADKVVEKEKEKSDKAAGKTGTDKGAKGDKSAKPAIKDSKIPSYKEKEQSDNAGTGTGGSSSNAGNSNYNNDNDKKTASSSSSSASSEKSLTGGVSVENDSNKSSSSSDGNKKPVGSSPLNSFTMAGSMIIFSEVGDKTFLIAALMAMKHPRVTVFTAAFASLAVMTVLSALMGHALPALLPKKLTSILAAVLFVVFGARLLREGLAMDSNLGVDEELEEVEIEIEAKELILRNDELESGNAGGIDHLRRSTSSPKVSDDGLEKGSADVPLYKVRSRHNHNHNHHQPSSFGSSFKSAFKQLSEGVGNLAALVLSPVWVQVFIMTFLGEWGDRSQVATIAMAAGSDYWFVILGAIAGHGLCTLAAVVGGRFLATKISMRQVTIAGAVSFLVFAIIYFREGLSLSWSDN